MPLKEHMTLISVDDHLIEPAGLRADRLPATMREAGPRVIETDMDGQSVDQGHVRTNEGRTYPTVALTAVAERRTR